MSSARVILASLTLAAAPAFANGGDAAPGGPMPGKACVLAGPALDCVARADEPLATIVARFAHPETGALFTRLGGDTSGYRDERPRELLRQSLERNNERSIRLLERARRRMEGGHIAQATFETVRQEHLRAFANYRLGIEFYQRAQWFDPQEPTDFAPRELVPPSS